MCSALDFNRTTLSRARAVGAIGFNRSVSVKEQTEPLFLAYAQVYHFHFDRDTLTYTPRTENRVGGANLPKYPGT